MPPEAADGKSILNALKELGVHRDQNTPPQHVETAASCIVADKLLGLARRSDSPEELPPCWLPTAKAGRAADRTVSAEQFRPPHGGGTRAGIAAPQQLAAGQAHSDAGSANSGSDGRAGIAERPAPGRSPPAPRPSPAVQLQLHLRQLVALQSPRDPSGTVGLRQTARMFL